MKRFWFVLPLLLFAGCLLSTGCMWKQVGSSEWGWKQESRSGFYQETKPHTEDEWSAFEANFEALVNHFIDLQKDEKPSE